MTRSNDLIIEGAEEHNLRNISLRVPKNRLVVVTGPSGSGKSSLVSDTLYRESQRLFFESLALYSRSYVRAQAPARVRRISHLNPSISIDQKTRVLSRRSVVGTVSEILDYLRLLYSRFGSYSAAEAAFTLPIETLGQELATRAAAGKAQFFVLLVENRKGAFRDTFYKLRRQGYVYALVDGVLITMTPDLVLDFRKRHTIEVLVDQSKTTRMMTDKKITELRAHLGKLASNALICRVGDEKLVFSANVASRPRLEPHHFSFNSPFGKCKICDGEGEDVAGETCTACGGSRVQPQYGAVYYHGINFSRAATATLAEARTYFEQIKGASDVENAILEQVRRRLKVLNELGLGYLPVSRRADSLSGGETQRLRIGSQISLDTAGMLYLFDEPSIGLHPLNTARLIAQLKWLAERNSVMVVEHDLETIRASDYLVELGPGGGTHGGEVVYSGPTGRFLGEKSIRGSRTHPFARARARVPKVDYGPPADQPPEAAEFRDIRFRNLDIPMLTVPLRQLVTIAGVSGSGKSSLLFDVMIPRLREAGHQVYSVTQDPIGKSSRSAVVTFLEIYQFIRGLFAASPSSRIRGLSARDFSFNTSQFRCERCEGAGLERFDMRFLSQNEMTCELCQGKRFTPFVLRAQYAGKNIAEALDMTIEEAGRFFHAYPKIAYPLRMCYDLGLGYLKLGQPSSTLSGGEAQRLKMIFELTKRRAQGHVYCLDEPTTGLSSYDIQYLLKLFSHLISANNSVFVIEHNTDIIGQSQHIVELGPGGGPEGGRVIAQGAVRDIRADAHSLIAPYLVAAS